MAPALVCVSPGPEFVEGGCAPERGRGCGCKWWGCGRWRWWWVVVWRLRGVVVAGDALVHVVYAAHEGRGAVEDAPAYAVPRCVCVGVEPCAQGLERVGYGLEGVEDGVALAHEDVVWVGVRGVEDALGLYVEVVAACQPAVFFGVCRAKIRRRRAVFRGLGAGSGHAI